MKKKKAKTGNESLHPLGDKLEEILDVMSNVRESLDTWSLKDCDLSSPCLETNEDTGETKLVILIGNYDFQFTIEEFVERSFDVLECGSFDYSEVLVDFRRQFDIAVIKQFEKYKTRSDPEEVSWAEEQIASYKRELDGRI